MKIVQQILKWLHSTKNRHYKGDNKFQVVFSKHVVGTGFYCTFKESTSNDMINRVWNDCGHGKTANEAALDLLYILKNNVNSKYAGKRCELLGIDY